MNRTWQDDCISFEYNGQMVFCRITDNNSPIRTIRGIEKMSRYANFYDCNNNPIVTGWAVYGTEEEMTNISPSMVEGWYKDYLNQKTN